MRRVSHCNIRKLQKADVYECLYEGRNLGVSNNSIIFIYSTVFYSTLHYVICTSFVKGFHLDPFLWQSSFIIHNMFNREL